MSLKNIKLWTLPLVYLIINQNEDLFRLQDPTLNHGFWFCPALKSQAPTDLEIVYFIITPFCQIPRRMINYCAKRIINCLLITWNVGLFKVWLPNVKRIFCKILTNIMYAHQYGKWEILVKLKIFTFINMIDIWQIFKMNFYFLGYYLHFLQ